MDDEVERLTLARYLMTARPEQLTAPAPAPGMSHAANTSLYDQGSDLGREILNYMSLGHSASYHRGETLGQWAQGVGEGALGGAGQTLNMFGLLPSGMAEDANRAVANNPYAAMAGSLLPYGGLAKVLQAAGYVPKVLGAAGAMLWSDANNAPANDSERAWDGRWQELADSERRLQQIDSQLERR